MWKVRLDFQSYNPIENWRLDDLSESVSVEQEAKRRSLKYRKEKNKKVISIFPGVRDRVQET